MDALPSALLYGPQHVQLVYSLVLFLYVLPVSHRLVYLKAVCKPQVSTAGGYHGYFPYGKKEEGGKMAGIKGEREEKKKIKTNAQALGTAQTATFCVCASFLACAGNGKFWKCKSVGLKIQRINVLHMWHSGRERDILTAEEGGREGASSWSEGFSV